MKLFIPIVKHSLKYNPSIDGLRGIAISLVLLFHVWPKYFSFGYVGVDIFFVLSGYLITQIIYRKLETNTFSIKEFYRNRIRRIFPSLIVVILTTLLIGYTFMFPSELSQLGKHIKSSAFFYENFRLMKEVGYWDEAAVFKPLLHFWSLAIEEQFYIFWPLLLIYLYRLRFNIVVTLSLVFLIFFTLPHILEIDKFYHTLSRAWELSFGGLIFVISYKYEQVFKYLNRYKVYTYILFACAILISYNNITFSTIKTFLIVFSSALVILAVSNQKTKTIFSNYVLVFFGLISFPLYLWHYVLISYAHIIGIEIKYLGFVLILVSILLSYLTYRYIEIYTRQKSSYSFALFLFFVIILLGALGNYVFKKDGLPNRNHLKSNGNIEKQFKRTPAQNELGVSLVKKIIGYKSTNNYIKATSDNLNKEYILIIGDSHAHTSYHGFSQEFKKNGYETLLFANSGLYPVLNGARGKELSALKEREEKINSIYKLLLNFKNIEKVIFISRGTKYLTNRGYGSIDEGDFYKELYFKEYFNSKKYNHSELFFKKTKNTFAYFNEKKVKFYFLLENPELGFHPKSCITRPFIYNNICRINYKDYLNRQSLYRNTVKNMAIQYKYITVLDPEKIYCDNMYCYPIRNKKMLYADHNHHSVDGSIVQAKYLINKIIKKKEK